MGPLGLLLPVLVPILIGVVAGCQRPAVGTATAPAAEATPVVEPAAENEAARRRQADEQRLRLAHGRLREQRADPRSAAAQREHVESVLAGEPNYESLAPELAAAIRQAHGARERMRRLGAIRSIDFRGVVPAGSGNVADRYEVETQNGRVEWLIDVAPDGLVRHLRFRAIDGTERIPLEPEAFARALRAELERATRDERFSGTILIARHGRTLFESAHGLADRERGIPNTLETRFRIGSMNKMFTAVAVMQLVEAGVLRLEDTLDVHLPDYPNLRLRSAVTLDHLLTHVGGTGDIFGPKYSLYRRRLQTLQDYLALYGNRDPFFEPGSRFEYSNYGFVLLGRVIERASGESYYEYVRERVFAPAGMTHTASLPEAVAVPGRSIGYLGGPGHLQSNADTLPPRGTSAGGGYSTVRDMLRFATALGAGRLLGAERVAQLTTGVVDLPNAPPGVRYGRGFFDSRPGDQHWFGHSGGAPGMNGELRVFPESGYVVVALSNLDPPAASAMVRFATARLPE